MSLTTLGMVANNFAVCSPLLEPKHRKNKKLANNSEVSVAHPGIQTE